MNQQTRKKLFKFYNLFFGQKEQKSDNLRIHFRPYKRFLGHLILKENNLTKTLNLIKAVISWKFHSIKLNSYPLCLFICPGNICNLKCKLCPTGLNQEGRKKGFMKFEDFKKIIDECGPYLYDIQLYNWGEPFLNKDLIKMARYAKQKYGIRIIISSNLMVLDDKMIKDIIDSEIDMLIFSLHGISNESLEKYQTGTDPKKVFSNVLKLIKLKEKQNKTKPIIQWHFVVNKYNEEEIKLAEKLSKEYRINQLSLVKLAPNFRTIHLKNEKERFEELKKWNPKNEKHSFYNYKTGKRKFFEPNCTWPWFSSSINWNGSVSPCCGLWYEKYDFGNCLKSSFKNVWNNQKYQNARKAILGKKTDKSNVCGLCKKNNAYQSVY